MKLNGKDVNPLNDVYYYTNKYVLVKKHELHTLLLTPTVGTNCLQHYLRPHKPNFVQ